MASSTKGRRMSFNLNRDARPLATAFFAKGKSQVSWFQSQPRCQAPGDKFPNRSIETEMLVSISTEMPGPWRLRYLQRVHHARLRFNLNRDARPLATCSRQTRSARLA